MSIHDVSKSKGRLTPAPNVQDKQAQKMSHGTNSANYVTDATDADTNDRILYGYARLVLTGTLTVSSDGSTLTTSSDIHNLGFVPNVLAALENANVTIVGGTAVGASMNLPTFTTADIGVSVSGDVSFGTWLYAFADDTRVYVNMLNATGIAQTVHVTYYLYQQTARS